MGNVTHTFVSAVADGADTSVVRPLNWNAAHTVPTNSIVKNNFSASSNPTVNDDTGDGYEVGSRWINIATAAEYVCFDASSGAAVWTVGGGGIPEESAASKVYAWLTFR